MSINVALSERRHARIGGRIVRPFSTGMAHKDGDVDQLCEIQEVARAFWTAHRASTFKWGYCQILRFLGRTYADANADANANANAIRDPEYKVRVTRTPSWISIALTAPSTACGREFDVGKK